MKKHGTHSNFAHKPEISAVSTLSRIWLSVGFGRFDIGFFGALWFEIQADLDFDLLSEPVDLV